MPELTIPAAPITAEVASHVLAHHEAPGGVEPTDFIDTVIAVATRVGAEQFLALITPYAHAAELATKDDGIALLQVLAGQPTNF
ncbi:hypothetical protein [Streptosporangium sp. CA-115845]|uniref:hypothetical protein n=1 Tax=Streptosporangium sp. CA-115845 TaxID=3240071 RepID=UPI003D8DCCA1